MVERGDTNGVVLVVYTIWFWFSDRTLVRGGAEWVEKWDVYCEKMKTSSLDMGE